MSANRLNCRHRQDCSCAVSAQLAGLNRIDVCTDEACIVCERQTLPQARNKVTMDLAIAALHFAGDADAATALLRSAPDLYPPAPSNTERVHQILAGQGVGSRLVQFLEIVNCDHKANCRFLAAAQRWNDWGPPACRVARAEIVTAVAALLRNYRRNGELPPSLHMRRDEDTAASFVDAAINSAEQGSNVPPLPPQTQPRNQEE